MNNLGNFSTSTKTIEMKGGVNEHTPSLSMPPGNLIECVNYTIEEGTSGGYTSVQGYERVDGSGVPSTALSVVFRMRSTEQVSTVIQIGDIITGDTGDATAVTVGVAGDMTQEVEVEFTSDTFLVGEELYINSTLSTLQYSGTARVSPSEDFHKAWGDKRASILPVPGELAVLGLYIFQNQIVAFRKKELVLEVGMYLSDGVLGWVEVDTSADPIVYEPFGTHTFEFVVWNFYGGTTASPELDTSEESLFWVDSQNKARYYNPTEGVVIIDNPGMDPEDTPTHICALGSYLWMSYRGGSVQHSTVGLPKDWVTGPGEYGMGKEVTALHIGVGATLIVFMDNGIRIKEGEDVATWVWKTFSRDSGAYPGTPQRLLGTTFFMDDRGLTTLEAVDAYGDYSSNSITQNFKKTFLQNKSKGTVASINRELNQYRMYFNNGLGIIVSFAEKELQGSTFTLYPISVDVIAEGFLTGKAGVTIFSSTVSTVDSEDVSGFVYLMDSGTNFDGVEILTKASTSYYHYGSPRNWKRFISCVIEATLPSELEFSFKIDFNYHNPTLPTSAWITGDTGDTISTTAIYSASIYGEGIYGAAPITQSVPMYLFGYGSNAGFQWITQDKWAAPHNIQNIIVDYRTYRRLV